MRRRKLSDRSGGAAVEMALMAPVLIASLLAMADLGMTIYGRLDMQTAVRAGLQYVMAGGGDLDVAEEIVLQAWQDPPSDASVRATRFCLCGEAEAACSSQCPDSSRPKPHTRISASATLGMFLFSTRVASEEAARVR